MARREVVIGSTVGLHARPAALFVQAATAQDAGVRIGRPGAPTVDARSILSVLALGAKGGETVVLEADGANAEPALEALTALLERDLDAEQAHA